MENYLELISVPAIAAIVYWVIEIVKYTLKNSEKFKRFIPIVAAVLGAILGVGCFYLVPNTVPATNVFIALVIGAASGLTATGANQIFKQLTKGNTDGTK
jgi:multidrug transporter EmrE-like cation transporter